jgi:hypothetical protein
MGDECWLWAERYEEHRLPVLGGSAAGGRKGLGRGARKKPRH